MSSKLSQLCDKYQAIVFFDTETTGLDPSVDQIIELAAVRITRNQAGFLVLDEKMDAFVKLLEGQKLPDKIVELTHITDEMIQKDGVDATAAASAFNNLIRGRTLLVAHNAQFDLLFSRALLHYTDIGTARLDACDYIDSLTVYKDRAAYPHKLANAIEHYSLEGKVKNSHRAIDDVLALYCVTYAMAEERMDLELNQVYDIDCIQGMKQLEAESIDMILCDLPYGITARNRWDTPIDMTELWQQYRRIIKEHGAIVLFGTGIFTADMMAAGRDLYRYNLIWQKTNATNFLNANRMPLRTHEDIMVFYKKLPPYHPQKTGGHKPVNNYTKSGDDGTNYGRTKRGIRGGGNTDRYPTSIIRAKSDKQHLALHPTQKPVDLLRWLIRTYTDEDALVLDNACGSGSTCVAAVEEGRNYIGMDNGTCENKNSPFYCRPWAEVAATRIEALHG